MLFHLSLNSEMCFRAIDSGLGGTKDKKMSMGHLLRVVYHQVCNVYGKKNLSIHVVSLVIYDFG